MEPENLTVRLLQEIRDEVRHSSEKSEVRFEKMDQHFATMGRHFETMERHAEVMQRLLQEIINTASSTAR